MDWRPIDVTTPGKWWRSKAWRWGDSRWIVAAAYCPTMFSVGGELLTGFGKGFALIIGPFWLGVAASFANDPTTQEPAP